MSSRDRSVNVTDGELVRPLLVLSLPIVLTNLLQVGYNLADTFWVGRLGSDAVAELSYSWAIVFMMISISSGLTVAGTVLVAQNKGANNREQSHHVAGQTIAFVALVMLTFSIIGIIMTPTMLAWIGAEPGTQAFIYAVEYTQIVFVGLTLTGLFFVFTALMRGWGDTRTPLYLMAGSVALNVALDPFLILGIGPFPRLEVQGAAIATLFSRGIAASIGMWLLFSGRTGLQPGLSDLRLRLDTVRKILEIGLPTTGEQAFRSLGVTALTAIVALAGTDAVAAYGIVSRLSSLVFLPSLGLAQGTEAVVGQNLGARQVDRAKRAVYTSGGLVAGVLVVIGATGMIFSEQIISVFITGEGADVVIEIGTAFLMICGPAFAFLGVFQVTLGGFRGSGSTRTAMILSIQELWIYRIPLAYVMLAVFDMGVIGVWYAMAFSYVASAIITVAWFTRGTWTESAIEEGEQAAPADD